VRCIRLILTFSILPIAIPSAVAADSKMQDIKLRVQYDNASIHSKAYASANNIKCRVPKNSEVPIITGSRRKNWFKVDTSGFEGCPDTGYVYGGPPLMQVVSSSNVGFVATGTGNPLWIKKKPSFSKTDRDCIVTNGTPLRIIGTYTEEGTAADEADWLMVDMSDNPKCDSEINYVYRKFVTEYNAMPVKPINPVTCHASTNLRSQAQSLSDDLTIVTQERINAYSESQYVKDLISAAMSRKYSASEKICYKRVKEALISSRLIDEYHNEKSAFNAGKHLIRDGFVNLMDPANKTGDKVKPITNAYDAPKGSILVYDGGDDGHIEIKVGDAGQGGFVSDYYSEVPRTLSVDTLIGAERVLIGVYIKPGVTE
jgi:hypothetical protein